MLETKKIRELPKKPTKGLLGDLKSYVEDPLGFLQQNVITHGDVFSFRLAHRRLHFVNDPSFIEHLLQRNHRNYRKSLAYRKLELLLGNGLFNTDGDFWRKQRRLAQPAFHKDKIDGYAAIIVKHTNQMIQRLQATGEIHLSRDLTQVTLKIIAEALLGLQLEEQGKVIESELPAALKFMIRRITSSLNAPMWIPTDQNKAFTATRKKLDQVIMSFINHKRANGLGQDLLSDLMAARDDETGEAMSDQQLRDEMLTFFLAGHETSAVSLFWLICLIHQHEEVLKKVRTEIAGVSMSPSPEELNGLHYTDAVIKESMRMISPIWVISREAINDDEIQGYRVKKGDSIIFSPYLMHHHASWWEEPHKFDPSRFLGDQMPKHKFSYFPFGGGPRLCIGNHFALMEIKIILIRLLQEFEFQFGGQSLPKYDCSLTLRPANERRVKLKSI